MIKEISAMYLKKSETFKGGIFSNAAAAILKCKTSITNKQDALLIKGIGRGIASIIEEFLATGVASKLEELKNDDIQEAIGLDIVANESNREIINVIKEISVMYFKNKETMKGGAYSNAATALRRCETPITNKQEALAVKGVGKTAAGFIEEFLETGIIDYIERLRTKMTST